jgi:hypothetical protein
MEEKLERLDTRIGRLMTARADAEEALAALYDARHKGSQQL